MADTPFKINKFEFAKQVVDQEPQKILSDLTNAASKLVNTRVEGIILKNTIQIFQSSVGTTNTDKFKGKLNIGSPDVQRQTPTLPQSSLGMRVFSNLDVSADSYQDNAGNTIGEFTAIQLPAVIIKVSREANKIVTDIQGRNGSIIEYNSWKSYHINITGKILSSSMGAYPYDVANNLQIALNSNKSLRVNSWYLNLFGINFISLLDFDMPQNEGGEEWQEFTLNAISDEPVTLKIIK
jgi:hypothetical protein